MSSVEDFYSELAGTYHLIYADWDGAIARHGAVLDRLLRPRFDRWPLSVLDCSCGIGTQAIGLAQLGYITQGSDISSPMVARARDEAMRRGVSLEFRVADMRALRRQIDGTFDAVISCDNALPHLLTDDDLSLAIQNMSAVLRDDGWVLISIRDYDLARETRPQSEGPRILEGPDGKRIGFQVWDWTEDGRFYEVHQFLALQRGGTWQVQHASTIYRALLREDVSRLLGTAGFQQIEWLLPTATGFHQPIVIAQHH